MKTATTSQGLRIIILGATSAIAMAAARRWSTAGAKLVLVARDSKKLDVLARDLTVRGAEVETRAMDLAKPGVASTLDELTSIWEGTDIILLAYGILGEQEVAEANLDEAARLLEVNFTSAAQWSLAAANTLERQKHGSLIVIGSVVPVSTSSTFPLDAVWTASDPELRSGAVR